MTLPHINRAFSENSVLYNNNSNNIPITFNDDGNLQRKFDQCVDTMVHMNFPTLDALQSVKGRLNNLEATADTQSEYNKQTEQSLTYVSKNLQDVDLNIKSLILSMQNDFDQRLASLKKEYDHR